MTGTAWELLTNPKTGAGTGVVLSDGYTVILDAGTAVSIADRAVMVALVDNSRTADVSGSVIAQVNDSAIEVLHSTDPIETEVA